VNTKNTVVNLNKQKCK